MDKLSVKNIWTKNKCQIADFITSLQFLDDVLTTPVGSTYFNDLQGKTKQLLDFVGLYFRANGMYGRPPLPATMDGVQNAVEEWFRYGCFCQLRDPTYGVRSGQIISWTKAFLLDDSQCLSWPQIVIPFFYIQSKLRFSVLFSIVRRTKTLNSF